MNKKLRKNRLAQHHKLASLSEHLAKLSNFTAEEVRMLLLIHQKMEEHGPLDRNRFREVLSIIFTLTDDLMLDLVFRAFDKDMDGYVDDIEWVKGMSTMLRGTLEQLTDFAYSVYDMNGDGSLAREELYHCLKGCIFTGYGVDDDEIEDCERDIVEIAMRKLDTDRDGQITYEDFVRAVKKDALLLQACGCCIPSTRCASAFQSLITEKYHMKSALYPTMPSAKSDKLKKSRKSQKVRKMWAPRHGSDVSDSGSLISVSSSHDDLNSVLPRHSKVAHPLDKNIHRMSLSVVKHGNLGPSEAKSKPRDKLMIAPLWKQ